MVEKANAVLNAGGTVYLGENHAEPHARRVAIAILRSRSVQFLCIEVPAIQFAIADKEADVSSLVDVEEFNRNVRRFDPEVKMSSVAQAAADDPGCSIVHIDLAPGPGDRHNPAYKGDNLQRRRQLAMRDRVQQCRRSLTSPTRGVLAIVGSSHLDDKEDIWQALHEIVYTGHSFVFGKYGTCYMVWQLS